MADGRAIKLGSIGSGGGLQPDVRLKHNVYIFNVFQLVHLHSASAHATSNIHAQKLIHVLDFETLP
jgi:hypothetical protein